MYFSIILLPISKKKKEIFRFKILLRLYCQVFDCQCVFIALVPGHVAWSNILEIIIYLIKKSNVAKGTYIYIII